MAKGKKTGGRKRGTPNKSTKVWREKLVRLKARGRDPMTFFADILGDEAAPLDLRFAAAKELAPYMHPKLASIEARSGGATHEERLARLREMMADTQGGVIEHEDGGGRGTGPTLPNH